MSRWRWKDLANKRDESKRDWMERERGEENDSVDEEEVRGDGVKGRKRKLERDSIYSLCNSLYHQPRSWRMNSDPSQPSAEAR